MLFLAEATLDDVLLYLRGIYAGLWVCAGILLFASVLRKRVRM